MAAVDKVHFIQIFDYGVHDIQGIFQPRRSFRGFIQVGKISVKGTKHFPQEYTLLNLAWKNVDWYLAEYSFIYLFFQARLIVINVLFIMLARENARLLLSEICLRNWREKLFPLPGKDTVHSCIWRRFRNTSGVPSAYLTFQAAREMVLFSSLLTTLIRLGTGEMYV